MFSWVNQQTKWQWLSMALLVYQLQQLPNSVLAIRHHLIHKVQVTFELLWPFGMAAWQHGSMALPGKAVGTSGWNIWMEHSDQLD